ncbi:MAG: metallophosphoesterase [Oscillospiraceae bacterium]|nr:metallophosphoesterase [Oscillospiraceae bacterium]
MAVFFIADTHFGDDAIMRYECRPFDDTAAMERELIRRWNEKVGEDDSVYILGDFAEPGSEERLLKSLKGKKYLVRGNHDTRSNEYYRASGFTEVYDLPVLFEKYWILSHEPLYVCENMPYANIFGHVHASPIYKDSSSHHFCVSVERTGYAPISFDEIKKAVADSK